MKQRHPHFDDLLTEGARRRVYAIEFSWQHVDAGNSPHRKLTGRPRENATHDVHRLRCNHRNWISVQRTTSDEYGGANQTRNDQRAGDSARN